MDSWEPGYVLLHRTGELSRRAEQAYGALAACNLCHRRCGVDRRNGPAGVCRAGRDAIVGSWTSHKWEEPPISGTGGAGTIFLSQCTGRCIFCQNFSISQMGVGRPTSVERLAWMMLDLQKRGCHNVEFVTPTHYIPPILAALDLAAAKGLRLPAIWNTNGYDSLEALALLDGAIDIYLPDAKYADDRVAVRLSGFPKFVEGNHAALREMHRQMGDELVLDDNGLARRGLIIRHLILPNNLAQTAEVLHWIADNLSPDVHVSLMNQYFPTYKTVNHATLGRAVSFEEYDAALDAFDAAGLNNGWGQDYDDSERWDIDQVSKGTDKNG